MTKQIMVVGDYEVTKKFLEEHAIPSKIPGENKYTVTFLSEKEPIELILYDINILPPNDKPEDSNTAKHEFLRKMDVFIFIYSVINRASFDNIHHQWQSLFIRFSAPIIVVGTDLEQRNESNASHINTRDTAGFASIWGSKFYCECSSKDSNTIKKILEIAYHAAEFPDRQYPNLSSKITSEIDIDTIAPPRNLLKASLSTSPRIVDDQLNNSGKKADEASLKYSTQSRRNKGNTSELPSTDQAGKEFISTDATTPRGRNLSSVPAALTTEPAAQINDVSSNPLDVLLSLITPGLSIFSSTSPASPKQSLPINIIRIRSTTEGMESSTKASQLPSSPTSPRAKDSSQALSNTPPSPINQTGSPSNDTPALGAGRVKAMAKQLKDDIVKTPPPPAHIPNTPVVTRQFKKS